MLVFVFVTALIWHQHSSALLHTLTRGSALAGTPLTYVGPKALPPRRGCGAVCEVCGKGIDSFVVPHLSHSVFG